MVKFSQKLGFKGYPDLKYSIGEAIARADNGDATVDAAAADSDPRARTPIGLWRRKSEAEEETRADQSARCDRCVAACDRHAPARCSSSALGEDDIHARAFALKLSLLGILTVHNFDTAHMTAERVGRRSPATCCWCSPNTARQPALCQICRYFREQRGKVVTVTRHTSNPLRAHADLSLAGARRTTSGRTSSRCCTTRRCSTCWIGVFVLLCEGNDERHARAAGQPRTHPADAGILSEPCRAHPLPNESHGCLP